MTFPIFSINLSKFAFMNWNIKLVRINIQEKLERVAYRCLEKQTVVVELKIDKWPLPDIFGEFTASLLLLSM